MGAVNDFDLSDVADGTVSTAETGATGVLKWLGNKLAVNVLTKVMLSIGEGEYRRIVAENDRQQIVQPAGEPRFVDPELHHHQAGRSQ